jgi:DNA-binding response OmpR family regulator
MAAAKRIRLVVDIDASLGVITIDGGRLKQVLYNYLSNALKFTPEGGTVSVRAFGEDATTFRIEVQDTGQGISADGMTRLFREFEQLDGHRRGGTGLGLALTKRLVEAQGGSVGAISRVGGGSTFHAVLPRTAKIGSALPPPRVIPGAQPDARVVLVIEDDADDQEILVRALTQAGYAVETAATRAQALARCRERRFDAIMLDLLLPDASGLKVLEAIRAETHNRDVPVLVASVVADRALVAGFAVHDALSKPLDSGRLLASLRRAGVAPDRDGYILVVDDDPGSLGVMQSTLAQLGYRTSCVTEGEAGLSAAEAAEPLAVILDLMMPGMNGFEFLERFRRHAGRRDVPVLIWTLKDLTHEEEELLRASAQSVVKKTPDTEGLAAEIRALCEAREHHHG